MTKSYYCNATKHINQFDNTSAKNWFLFCIFNSANHISMKKGHAGHDEPDDETMEVPPLKSNEHLYNLNGQIDHKVNFIIIIRYISIEFQIYSIFQSQNDTRLNSFESTFHMTLRSIWLDIPLVLT